MRGLEALIDEQGDAGALQSGTRDRLHAAEYIAAPSDHALRRAPFTYTMAL